MWTSLLWTRGWLCRGEWLFSPASAIALALWGQGGVSKGESRHLRNWRGRGGVESIGFLAGGGKLAFRVLKIFY